MTKKKSVQFRVDENMDQMVNLIMQSQSYGSRAQVYQEAVRRMYKSLFPSYSSKPTPIPAVGGQTAQRTAMKARVANKTALKQEEANEIIENGKAITRLLSGKVVNATEGIESIGCEYKQMDNAPKTRTMNAPVFFTDMHSRGIWNDDRPIEENDVLQIFLLETKFRDLNLDDEKEKLTKKLTNIENAMRLGIERGDVSPDDFTYEVLTALFLYMNKYSVNTAELKATMAEHNFDVPQL